VRVIDAITRSIVDPHLVDAFTDRLHVSEAAKNKTPDACVNPRERLIVPQLDKPSREDFGLTNLDHLLTIVHVMILVKQFR
jgi:hypothetical protein